MIDVWLPPSPRISESLYIQLKGGGKHTFTFSLFTTQSFIIYLTNIKHLLIVNFDFRINKEPGLAFGSHWTLLYLNITCFTLKILWIGFHLCECCVRPESSDSPTGNDGQGREGALGTEPCTAAFRVSLHFVFYLSFCLKDFMVRIKCSLRRR